MLFNSEGFIFLYLPIVFIVFFAIAQINYRIAAGSMVAASLVFYGWWNPPYVLLLIVSIAFNYACSVALNANTPHPTRQSWLLLLGVVGNLGALFYYKYLFPLLGFLHAVGLPGFGEAALGEAGGVILPLGISFFTFTQLGYLIDCRQGLVKPQGVLNYALFVTFFPHLIAGPILHHKEIMPQFADPATYRIHAENLSVGSTIFIVGLFKKVVLADNLATFAHPIFDAHAGANFAMSEAWLGTLAYSLQLYFDFSGYSDMAIGLARLFGITFPINFNSPYKARCIIDFWRRWHMTLTRYLTLYLYSPIGLWVTRRRASRGYRVSSRAAATPGGFASMIMLPTFVTMALIGIWHGAGFQFIIFGLLHACYLAINHAWRVFSPRASPQAPRHPAAAAAVAAGQVLLTYVAVLVGQVFFRAGDTAAALSILRGMAGLNGIWGHSGQLAEAHAIAWIIPMLAIVWLLPNVYQVMAAFNPALTARHEVSPSRWQWQPTVRNAILAAAMGFACVPLLNQVSEFLYFQF